MKALRIAGWCLAGTVCLLVGANLVPRGYQYYRAGALSTAFMRAHPQAVGQSPAERVAIKARDIAARIDSTRYSHWTTIDEAAGVYVTDCSGLACYLLRNAASRSYHAVPTNWFAHRPQASMFYNTFLSSPDSGSTTGWQRVHALADARPGDFIAWYSPGHRWWQNTGHIVTVIDTPVVEVGDTVRVRILESGGGRRIEDTNHPGNWGVGSGIAQFAVDETGALKGTAAIGRPVDDGQ